MAKTVFDFIWALAFLLNPKPGYCVETETEITPDVSLKQHMSFLTSSELGGRGPGTKGHRLARDFIIENLKAQGLSDVDYTQTKPRTYVFWRENKFPLVENIFARYSGTSVEAERECLVFTAHYDHLRPNQQGKVRPGANDNASGVVALLELASLLTEKQLKSAVDIWLVFPDQEENYIAGSPTAVSYLKEKCKKKIWANVNLDVVGGRFFEGLENRLLELTGNGGETWNQLLANIETDGILALQSDVYIIEPLGRLIPRSDYASFREKKIPFVFYTSGTPWYYHTIFDTEDRIDYPFLAKLVQRLYQIADSFSDPDNYQEVAWNDRSEIDYHQDAERFAQLVLQPYIDHAVANKLDVAEVQKWEERIAKLQDPDAFAPKRLVHQSILALLSSLEKRAELEMGLSLEGPQFHPEFVKAKRPKKRKHFPRKKSR